jgi:hypothetical protein
MKANLKISSMALMAVILIAQSESPLCVMAGTSSVASEWSVQGGRVEPGNVNIEPAFRVAIYENLLDELTKTGRFKQVFRSGDRRANDLPDLLIVKTTVEGYTPGSEARRAVTTVSGATKLKIRSQLCTRTGQVVFDRVVDGNVRFFGGNLRATYNFAHNLANAVRQAKLPDPGEAAGKN